MNIKPNRIKINWKGVLNAFDPTTIVRRYEVDYGSYSGGQSEYFWFKYFAKRRFENIVHSNQHCFVSMQDWFVTPDRPTCFSTMGSPTTLEYFNRGDLPPVRPVKRND